MDTLNLLMRGDGADMKTIPASRDLPDIFANLVGPASMLEISSTILKMSYGIKKSS
ncbi:hypothetical protein [Sphingobium aquiterrae]|uniref:hypothetical protein n=1 Tax=Sphingobium aquiterrae TaxID=2038656 RepID=UPI00301665FE